MKRHFLIVLLALLLLLAVSWLIFVDRQDGCNPVQAQHLIC